MHVQGVEEGAQLAVVEELGVLAFPKIQEKLYIEGKCIVPIELVETLAKGPYLDHLIKILGG